MSTFADRTARTVAVLGGTGKTGRAVRHALGERGVPSLALGRSAWGASDVGLAQGGLADSDQFATLARPLTGALAGCDALYLLAPNLHPDEASYTALALEAARVAGIRRVVFHSVASPYAPTMPHHLAKAASEDLVRRSGLDWTVLQPGAYLQNFLPALRDPRGPALTVPYDVSTPFGFADLPDVGAMAAEVIATPQGHLGATYEVAGPVLVSVADVATAAAEVLGRPVPCRRLAPAAWAAGPGAVLPTRERDWLLRMFDHYDRHGLPVGGRGVRAVLGRDGGTVAEVLQRELVPF